MAPVTMCVAASYGSVTSHWQSLFGSASRALQSRRHTCQPVAIGRTHSGRIGSASAPFERASVLEADSNRIYLMKNLVRMGLAVAALLFAAGCGVFSTTAEQPLELDFSQTLPVGWNAVGTWQQVNIDDDAAVEYLLLFTYDQGQVGGAIYDSQISADLIGVVDVSATPVPTPTVELRSVPLQPLAYYRPYRLLPSSWSYSYGGEGGHGYIARPGDSGRIRMTVVQSAGAENGEATAEEEATQTGTELVIRGGDTHLTFVWWRGPVYGYGVTQLAAEGGFRGIEWEEWAAEPTPIDEIAGLYPLTDYRARSVLCREILYTRSITGTHVLDAEVPSLLFSEQDRGIDFCLKPMPVHPYYPEGVVIAYLKLAAEEQGKGDQTEGVANGQAFDQLLSPGVSPRNVESEAALVQLSEEMITDIAAYPSVPALPSRVLDGEYLPTTTVCVEAAQREQPDRLRWVMFTLRYQPPDHGARLPDRWTISGATEIPPPPGDQPPVSYCESILAQATQ